MMLGPMVTPILICFESLNYIKNMGFLPGKDRGSRMFFGMQVMLWMMYVAIVVFLVLNRTAEGEDGEVEQPLDLYPFILVTVLFIFRSSIIAIRYATTH